MAENGGVSRIHGRSLGPKLMFAGMHGGILAVCLWIAFGGLALPDSVRAGVLAGCAALYFLRHLITLFVLLQRQVAMSEVFGLSAFIAVFEIGFVLLGSGILSGNSISFDAVDYLALVLVVLGSWLNTGSELQRWTWKKLPTSKGHAYTQGLFSHSMHMNYFGDTVLFTGWALLTHSWIALGVPVFMASSFVFFHIPALDDYLEERYGDEFKTYAARTAKFIPYVY